jgi:hypothetical protein
MSFGFPATVDENPARVWGVLLALLQHLDQFCRHLYVARLVFLGSETSIGLGADMVNPSSEVDILPGGVHHLLFTTSCSEEKLVANSLFLVHRCKEFLEFGGFVWDSGFFFVLWQVPDQ